ncbi:hypothetical protein IMCC3317_17880 [Kordia antarctica]|uniref:Uncharacterized protein n=1 Tax=Kordia antarctica TaxID=1218801 RepID=A0A7L4ZIJ4_9FLAO|nr:hypothetical protein IMCC3317_17880 [Kordia antarctica]
MGFLSDIWQKIEELFISNKSSTSSKYTSTESDKKFIINNNLGFKIVSASRPRSCEQCNSKKTITKSNNKWNCSIERGGCGYSW